jgi:hypothetical protein
MFKIENAQFFFSKHFCNKFSYTHENLKKKQFNSLTDIYRWGQIKNNLILSLSNAFARNLLAVNREQKEKTK